MNSGRVSRMGGLIALLAAIALALALLAGFFADLHPAFDSFAHFRVHLAVALALVAIPLLLARGLRLPGLVAGALGAWAVLSVTGLSVIPGLGPVQASHEFADDLAPVYKLMQLNLRYDNAEAGKVLSLIGRTRPDVVTLEEVSGMWREKLALLSSAYPHRIVCTNRSHVGGVAILSLRPFVAGNEGKCWRNGTLATATIDFGGRFVEVGALHLHWPWPRNQAAQIEDLAGPLGAMAETSILAGDLNATPWSAASWRIAEAAAMTAVGPKGPTWLLRGLPEWLRFAGLPIDRVFAKGDVAVRSIQTMEWVGSDHLPVLLEFSLDTPEVQPDAKTATAWLNPSN